MSKIISLKNISKDFTSLNSSVKALKKVSLEVESGSITSIVGYSGCGKSTLLKIISGLLKADSGVTQIEPDGDIGMVFQEPRLITSKTVFQNIELALHKVKDREIKRERVYEVLELLELLEFSSLYPPQLSGGMAQRVGLGRALALKPSLLILDEPFSALDALLRKKMQEELTGIFLKRKMTAIFVTHDVTEAVFLGSRVVVMREGEIIDDVNINLSYPRNCSSSEFLSYRDSLLNKIYTSRRF